MEARPSSRQRRTPALPLEEDRHVATLAMVCCSHCEPAGGPGGGGVGRGNGAYHPPPPPPSRRCWALLVLCRVVAAAATAEAATMTRAHSDPLPRVPRGRPSGDVPLRSKLNCGQNCHPSLAAGGAARGGLFEAPCRASRNTSASRGGVGLATLHRRRAEDLEGPGLWGGEIELRICGFIFSIQSYSMLIHILNTIVSYGTLMGS
jgi:hypothetical protein